MRQVTIAGNLKHLGAKADQPADAVGASLASEEAPRPPLVVPGEAREPRREPPPLVEKAEQLLRASQRPASGGRELLVRYDGKFVGVYRAPRKVTNRTAYRTIAAVLREEVRGFLPEKLTLFRTVELSRPSAGDLDVPGGVGRFTRFEGLGPDEPVV
jgi:hypothetical protein